MTGRKEIVLISLSKLMSPLQASYQIKAPPLAIALESRERLPGRSAGTALLRVIFFFSPFMENTYSPSPNYAAARQQAAAID